QERRRVEHVVLDVGLFQDGPELCGAPGRLLRYRGARGHSGPRAGRRPILGPSAQGVPSIGRIHTEYYPVGPASVSVARATRLRPAALAAYSAWSAWRTRSCGSVMPRFG